MLCSIRVFDCDCFYHIKVTDNVKCMCTRGTEWTEGGVE